MNFTQSRALQQRSHALIPGGAHTYAKGDDQFPELAPGFIVRGKGSHVWDPDGNEYIEYGMGCRAVALGHAFPAVVDAVMRELKNGSTFTRPAPLEVALAEKLLCMIRGGEMVKFAKDGSSVTTAALKLARAFTGRDHIALCGDHPFFSTYDWFIGTTAVDAGIPQSVKDLSLTFRYNDIDSVRELFRKYPGRIAALIMEPSKYEHPRDHFLHKTMEICHENGALFILDEMITGFRYHQNGAQGMYDIVPDLSAFGKALANGFSVSALVGKREIMELGGLYHDKERVFLLSTTHGAETHSLAAAIATINTYQTEPVIETIYAQGQKLKEGLTQVVERHGLSEYVKVNGLPCNLVYGTLDRELRPSQAFRALFMQETIKRGVIGPSLVISYSHTDEDIAATMAAWDGALPVYKAALENGIGRYLVGNPTQVVYRKHNYGVIPSFLKESIQNV